ncbi:putative prolyl 4-hydroxylase 3 [Glycine soja]
MNYIMSVLASMIDWIDYRLEPLMYVFGVVLIFLVHSFYFKFYLRNKKQGRCGVSRHQSHSHHTGLFALLRVLECIRIPEHKGKKWSTFSLVLWVLFFLTLILILLLALGIVYLPTTDDDFPTTDLSAFRRKTSQSGESLVENSEQWTEILSWEPRAFIYHNCLVSFRNLLMDLPLLLEFMRLSILSFCMMQNGVYRSRDTPNLVLYCVLGYIHGNAILDSTGSLVEFACEVEITEKCCYMQIESRRRFHIIRSWDQDGCYICSQILLVE